MTLKVTATSMQEGDGVTVYRLMPVAERAHHDPFVLWDHFTITPGHGFPDHPHRGFEAITFLFSGSIEHRDNQGNHATIHAGGAQAFCAGSGIIHSEMPAAEGNSEGIQLWINLPQHLKTLPPTYQQREEHELPQTALPGGGTLWHIVESEQAIHLHTEVIYRALQLFPAGHYTMTPPQTMRGILYLVSGQARVDGADLYKGEALLYEEGERTLRIDSDDGCRIMLCFGRPHREPIHQHGPFVD